MRRIPQRFLSSARLGARAREIVVQLTRVLPPARETDTSLGDVKALPLTRD